jgi:hypothetical protein
MSGGGDDLRLNIVHLHFEGSIKSLKVFRREKSLDRNTMLDTNELADSE